jgi:hypothetical protein
VQGVRRPRLARLARAPGEAVSRPRSAPELPAPSLWDGADERWFLVWWIASLVPGEPPQDYRSMRVGYERSLQEVLPARVPKRFWRSIQ